MLHVAPVLAALLVGVSLLSAPYRAETSSTRIVLTGSLLIGLFQLIWASVPVADTVCSVQTSNETVARPRVKYLNKLNALYGRTEISSLSVFVVSMVLFLAGFSLCYTSTVPRVSVLRELQWRPLRRSG